MTEISRISFQIPGLTPPSLLQPISNQPTLMGNMMNSPFRLVKGVRTKLLALREKIEQIRPANTDEGH